MAFLLSSHPNALITEANAQAIEAVFEYRPMVAYESMVESTGAKFTFVSDNLVKLLGYPAATLLAPQFDWFALIHADDQGAIAAAFEQLAVGDVKSLRYRVRHQSGEYCWLRDDIRVIQREQKTVILGSWLDISEQESLRQTLRQTQQDLKQSQRFTQDLLEAIATMTPLEEVNQDTVLGIIQNLTNFPKISELARCHSLERFQKLSSNIPGMIYQFVRRVDGSFKLLYTNDYVEEIFGVTREAAIADINALFSLMYPANNLTAFLEIVNESTETLSKWEQEWRIRLPSGQIKWLKGVAEPRPYPNGEIIWDGIIFDDSDRQQAEQELLENRALQSIVIHALQTLLKSPQQDFDAVLEYLGRAFWTDYACLICHSKPQEGARVVSEWQNDEGLAHPVMSVFENLDISPESFWIQQFSTSRDLTVNDLALLPEEALELQQRLDLAGFKRFLAIPVLQNEGQLWAVLCLARMQTDAQPFTEAEVQALRLIGEMFYIYAERQAQQEQLQTNENKFREIFDQAGVGIAKLDQQFHFIEVNKTLAKMIGATQTDFIGEPYWSISPTEMISGDRQIFLEVQDTGFVQHETRIYQNLGREIWVKLTISQVQPHPPEDSYYIVIFEDISQRKRSEEMTEALVLRDQLLITALGEVTYDHYLPQDILNWKGDYEGILGYSPEEIGMDTASWHGRVHPDDLDAVKAEFHRASYGDRLFDIEYRFRHRDGHYLWMHDRGILHGNYQGRPERFIGVFRDISKRKAAEQAQQRKDHLYQQIVETAQEGIWVIDADAKTEYVNPQMAKMLDYATDEMHGKSLFDFMDSNHVIEATANFQRRQEGMAEEHDFCFRSRAGREVWTMIATNSLLDDEGVFIGALGMVTDVTERRAAEQEIIRSQNLLEAIFEESADALFLVDMDTLLTFDCNKKAVTMFERDDKSELINIEGQTLQARQFTLDELKTIAADINRTGGWSRELQYVTKSGRVFWGNLAAKQVIVGDRRMNLVRVTDIDDRKRAEQKLRHTNRELERATKLKDEFLANMSHELRTPLNAILGLTEVLGDGTYGEINERQRRSLQTIERNGQHLLELINDVLNLAKIEVGQMAFHPVVVDSQQLCQSSVVLLRHQAAKKNINIQLDLPEGSPIIKADQLRLRQALLNLLGNAIKFTPEDGEISLRLELNPAANQVSIHVRDNGIGIAEDKLDQLFQPFVQLDSSLTRRFTGTGLGLALVKRIAELHNGSVSVSSRLGVGSKFSIHLPWSPPPQISEPIAEKPELTPSEPVASQKIVRTNGDRPLVLIADDDDDNIETIWDYLEGKGYRLLRAVNGREAVDLNESERPDLILMDIQMPELNGLDAMQLIREKFSADQLPIIALTALAMETDHQRCLNAGANVYLAKPFRLKSLIDHMENLLTSHN